MNKLQERGQLPMQLREKIAIVTEADGRHLNTTHFMEPEEIADVALFLAGQQSRAIHGQSLQVYGGVDYSYSLL
jgi:NAD(P)-dependent dehydrogenase (short-subunit alcohol dehydrogenase family)